MSSRGGRGGGGEHGRGAPFARGPIGTVQALKVRLPVRPASLQPASSQHGEGSGGVHALQTP